jgi:UV DNA damage endonuclease
MEAVTKIEKRAVVPQLGLVCITNSDAVRYKTVTRKRLLQFGSGNSYTSRTAATRSATVTTATS